MQVGSCYSRERGEGWHRGAGARERWSGPLWGLHLSGQWPFSLSVFPEKKAGDPACSLGLREGFVSLN